MDSLLANPFFAPAAVVAVVLLLAYHKFARHLSADDILGMVLGPRYAASKRKTEIDRLRRQGSYMMAGKLLEDDGSPEQAAVVYQEGREYFAAAAVLDKLGQKERAAELYLQAGDFKLAAQAFTAAGKPGRAAVLFMEKGNNMEAARLFAQAGMWDRAAEFYEKAGLPLRAAESYEKKGDFLKTAEAYERHFMENVSYSTTYSSTAVVPDQKSALLAGRFFVKAGALPRAVEAFARGGYFREAAEAALTQGQFARAAEFFMRCDDAQRAADAWERAGDPVKAANLRGEVAMKQDDIAAAALAFRQGRDYARAAELYEQAGKLQDAAQSYEEAESWAAAGSVYIRAGMKAAAGAAYERAGDYETAAKLFDEAGNTTRAVELYDRAGLTFKSAEAAAAAGDTQRAIVLFQKVAPTDEHFADAVEQLARLFLESDRAELALEKVQKALGDEPLSAATMPFYYWLARAHEARGEVVEAVAILRKVESEDVQYRDVAGRLKRLASLTPAPGANRMGRYTLVNLLGKGAMGEVYKAHDPTLNRHVALKLMSPAVAGSEEFQQRFQREAQSAARLGHPGIVTVHDFGQEGGRWFIAMEFLEGSDLRSMVGGNAPLADRLRVIDEIADALAYAHDKGVVHRDLKPGNIQIHGGRVKIVDFGLARVDASDMTRSGIVMGTPNYMSPEQARGEKADARSDVFSAGVIFYELLGRRRAFEAETTQGVIYQVLERQPEPLTQIAPDVPRPISEVVHKALQKAPAARFADGKALRDALRAAMREAGLGLERRASPPAPPEPAAGTAPATILQAGPAAAPATDIMSVAPESAPASPTEATAPPTRAAGPRFVLGEEIGRGALGVVHRGTDPGGRPVALRLLPPEITGDNALMTELLADLKAAARISNPHVARVFGLVDLGNRRPAAVSELVEGRDLATPLAKGNKMEVNQAHSLARILAQTLAVIHGQGLVHGSIQPSNVVVAGGTVKILDLGLGRVARRRAPAEDYHMPGIRLDVAGDLVDFAALLYHLLTGIHPRTLPQGTGLPLPSRYTPGVPEAMDRFLVRALHPREESRYPTAEAMVAELKSMVKIG